MTLSPLIASIRAQFTPQVKQLVAHVLLVFATAFFATAGAGWTGKVSVSTVFALLVASGSAGLTAVAHYALGLIPKPIKAGKFGAFYHAPKVVETKLAQISVSVVATFLIIAGTAALAGASSVSSFPRAADLIVAAIAAGVTGVVQYVTGLLPAKLQ